MPPWGADTFTSESVFCCQATFSSSDVLFDVFLSSPPKEFNAVKLAADSLSSCGDPDAYMTTLRFSSVDGSPLLLICTLWEVTFSCGVRVDYIYVCVVVRVDILYTQSLFLPLHEHLRSHRDTFHARNRRQTQVADKRACRNVLSRNALLMRRLRGGRGN